jgi:hypothetical protein
MNPFIQFLESLPSDELNEDVDSALLEESLRKRLSNRNPETRLDADRKLLENWLASFDSQSHPAHWISGFIFSVTAAELLAPNQIEDRAYATINIEPPPGWTAYNKNAELRKGKRLAVILVIDESTFDLLRHQFAFSPNIPPPIVATRTSSEVTFGESKGYKYKYWQSAPTPSTQIDYLLSVQGGFVSIRVFAMGIEIDETEFEITLHTLSICTPKA